MVKFLAKIAAQHILSAPMLGRLHQPLQKWVTGSIVVAPGTVQQKVDVGLTYLNLAAEAGLGNLIEQDPILDFGGGWHFTIPLLYSRLGAKNQIIVDIKRIAVEDVIFSLIRELNRMDLGPRALRLLPEPSSHQTLDDYLKSLGIRYEAPVAIPLPVEADSVGSVLCTQVLLHPPRHQVRAIFEETIRVLRPGGIFVASIHLYDVYSNFDPLLSRFNFLRYSTKTWERWFNNSHMSYNRLRAPDYRRLLEGLPFKTIIWEVTPPTDADIKELSRIKVHPDFSSVAREDLAGTHLLFVLQKV